MPMPKTRTKSSDEGFDESGAGLSLQFLDLALPRRRNREAELAERSGLSRIAPFVVRDLLLPELAIAFGNGCGSATPMTVPEASMNEDRPFLRAIGDVGRSRQVPVGAAVANSCPPEPTTEGKLRPGSELPNTAHSFRSRGVDFRRLECSRRTPQSFKRLSR
jgi:hypothetical protein